MSHTPGPWKAVRLAHGWIIGPQPDGVCTIHDNTDGSGFVRKAANARLITAAPDLLEACLEARIAMEAAVGDVAQLDAAIETITNAVNSASPLAGALAGATKKPTETKLQ
jgi:hypothetical protein